MCKRVLKLMYCDNMKLPVIVKPVDGNSSEGISVCSEKSQIINAYKKAIQASKSSQAIIEEYVESEGCGINVRYVVKDGKPYFS